MSEIVYEFEDILEQIQHTLATEDKQQFREIFFENHTYDQAQIYLSLTLEERKLAYQFLTPEEMAMVFELLEEDVEDVEEYLSEMDEAYVSRMLAEMYSDNAVDVLKQVGEENVRTYLRLMPHKTATELRQLLNYDDDTAGAMMTTEFIYVHESDTLKTAMSTVKRFAEDAETIYYVYVTDDENHLTGILTLKDLIVKPDEKLVKDIMIDRVVTVHVNDAQEEVVQTIKDYDFLAIPVVDDTNTLVGIITVDDALDVIEEEATSDYSGLAGVNVDEAHQGVWAGIVNRLPGIVTLLIMGTVTAVVFRHYEPIIQQASIFAIFITLITGTAGNTGTQSLAVAIRKIGLHEEEQSFWKVLVQEGATGFGIGLISGGMVFGIVSLWHGSIVLGGIIGFAMFASIFVAALTGTCIPCALEKFNFDPSIASGPFITTVNDLTSVLVYFTIVSQFISVYLAK